jgi:hypothetical protein
MRIRLKLSRDVALRACLPVFMVACLSTRVLAGTCPVSEWAFTTVNGWQTTADAVFDTSSGMTGPIGGMRVSIDVPGGQLGVYRCCSIGITATKLVDAFDVVGVTPGSSVTVVAELVIDGWILGAGCGGSGCWGTLRGTLSSGANSDQKFFTANIFAQDSVHVSGTVSLPVTIVVGSPVPIEFMLEASRAAGGNHGASGVGTIRFSALPAGAHVISCKGYGLGATPTRAPSWGAVKVLYR